MKNSILCTMLLAATGVVFSSEIPGGKEHTNSIGMKFVRIEPGGFMMGAEDKDLPEGAGASYFPGHYKDGRLPPAAGWKGYRKGLVGIVYDGSRPIQFVQTSQVDFDWTKEKRRDDTWVTRWRGFVKSPVTGNVTFEAEYDHGIRLTIDNKIVIDGWTDKKVRTGKIALVKDEMAPFVLEYMRKNEPDLHFYWTIPGGSREPVPADALWHNSEDHNHNLIEVVWVPERSGKNPNPKIGSDIYNEAPRHEVTITQPFYISQTEVTIDQFRKFRPGYPGYEKFAPYASGVSWYDAVAFCKWLSQKEGKPYRLCTEAEWEYVCRAGTGAAYSSGDFRPEPETANPWGVKNMHTNVAEWCLDWHGIYPSDAQVDPVGPEHGWFKVVRGGCLDYTQLDQPYYSRSSNRAAAPPSFGPPPLEYMAKQLDGQNMGIAEALNSWFKTSGVIPGRHGIGFRVAIGERPETSPTPPQLPFWQQCVKQSEHGVKKGPDPSKPYYRTRLLYPDFGRNSLVDVVWKIGIERGYGGGHHNSALQALPNGDLLAGYYNTMLSGERDVCVSLMTMRLRHGANDWDMPSAWPDMVDADDEAPIFWNDNGKAWLFWGCPRMEAGYPFQWTTSTDNGATWGPVQFPLFDSKIGFFSAQPTTSAFRDSKGTIYVSVDGSNPSVSSLLFASRDDGKTWYDTGGRTYGRHSCFTILDNDVILGYAGKQAELDGFHPQFVSRDGGRTYEMSASPLPALGGGVRASVVRLASGRIFYVGDMYLSIYRKLTPEMAPKGFSGDGAYAALSDDDGRTWRIRKLTGGNVLDKDGKPVKVHTVSYVTACQSPDGMIHLVTSHNGPDLHFELNEAWVLQGSKEQDETVSRFSVEMKPGTVKEYREDYPNGRPRVAWSAGIGEDGHYLIDGTETWHYQNGKKQWQAEYRTGQRTGAETYWSSDGKKQWQKVYGDDGAYVWTLYDADGNVKAQSTWQGKILSSHKIHR
ncbi:MAG TPA: SUMF1/EgtB/PvdO family nonheme iron enzyme [Sedimentisphaerales bacterium]|nr:SUMF1/EgtB/PvdO family nonheme iron enzyme [Sedimentisphaerales bacterium]